MRMISRSNDRILLKNVKQHPCLFERRCLTFRDGEARELAWTEVSKACHASVEYCKWRWIYLRGKYSRVMKVRSTGKRVNWPLDNEMKFLQKHIVHRDRVSTKRNNSRPSSSVSSNKGHGNISEYESSGEGVLNMTTEGENLVFPENDNLYQMNEEFENVEQPVDDRQDFGQLGAEGADFGAEEQLDQSLRHLSNIAVTLAQQSQTYLVADDEDISFGRTIAYMLKTLDPVTKNKARLKIMGYVGELQLKPTIANLNSL